MVFLACDLSKNNRIKLFGKSYPIESIEFYLRHTSESKHEFEKLKNAKETSLPSAHFNLKALDLFEIDPCKDSPTLQEVAELWQNEFKGPSEIPLSKFMNFILTGVYRVFVLTQSDLPQGKRISGFAVSSNYGQSYVEHLEYLAVSPSCRGRGLGSVLCQRFLQCLKTPGSKGPRFTTLECEASLIPFYSKLGWTESELEPTTYVMEKTQGQEAKPVKFYFMTQPLIGSDKHPTTTTSSSSNGNKDLERSSRFLAFNKDSLRSCREFLQKCADNFIPPQDLQEDSFEEEDHQQQISTSN